MAVASGVPEAAMGVTVDESVTSGVNVSVKVDVNAKDAIGVGVSVSKGVGGAEVGISGTVGVGANVAVGIAVAVSASVASGISEGGTSVGMIPPDCARTVSNPALVSSKAMMRLSTNRDLKSHIVSDFGSAYAQISM